MTALPALFIGHGNPMNTLERNANTMSWREIAAGLPRPRAILVVSAHWMTRGVAVTAMDQPETIHDFGGFPRELFEFQYSAPGDPGLAERVADLLASMPVRRDMDWGLDHGAWSVLAHLFPEADIPVVQLSLDGAQPPDWHFELAQRLQPLRDEGVLMLGSGNIVHNLRRMDWSKPERAFDWAERFNEQVRAALLRGVPATLVSLVTDCGMDEDGRLAAPTLEHYLPLLYVAAQRREGDPIELFNDRMEYGSIGMLSCRIG
jgi:4,5-DOPA dioxygenase extradiol